MNISRNQLTNMIKKQLVKTINENKKYNKMYSIVENALKEDFGEEWNYGNDNEWDEDYDYKDNINDKAFDNEDSWEEFDNLEQSNRDELGNNAQDIFDGHYDYFKHGDYFDDSDYRFTQDYWENDYNNGEWDGHGNTNGDIQRSRITDVYKKVENIVRESLKETMDSSVQNDTHFAISKPTNKIIFSWDYNGYDPVELRNFRKDYFLQDIIDNGYNPKDVKILTKNVCTRMGIDPNDVSNWENNSDNGLEEGKIKNLIKSKLNEKIKRQAYNKMYNIVRKSIVECLNK